MTAECAAATLCPTKDSRPRILAKLNTECLDQSAAAGRGELQRAGVAHAREPAAFEAAAADLGAGVARDVIAPFAPVEARPAIDAALRSLRREHGAEARQKPRAAVGEFA